MLPNKAKALHLVNQGFQVIPVAVNDDGSHNYSFQWKTTIINTPSLVDTYWYGDVDRKVAFIHPTIGVIDVDVKNGKNGFDALKEAGFELPNTYSYQTKSGGTHYLVRFPAGSTKWVPVEGVDVQVANGLAVWYGDVLSDEQLASIADAPAWAISKVEVKKPKQFNSIEWFDNLPTGEMSQQLLDILSWSTLQYPNIEHNNMRDGQYAIICEGAKGAVGVREALDVLKSRFLQGEFNTPEYQNEWNNGLKNLVIEKSDEIEQLIEANTDDARIEALGKEMFIQNQARAYAKRLEAEKFAIGTKAYSWEELEAMDVEWAIQGVLAFNTNCMLVGASNLGKTFLYIDWMCSSIAGIPWNGRETKKAKFMVVIGEGAVGWADRIKAWCYEHGQDYATIRQSITPMSAASLASDSDIEVMRSVAMDNGVDFIIFDTWNTNSGMTDENANAEAAMAMNAAARIKGDAGVLIIHHPNAETQNTAHLKARGATAVQGKMDFVVAMFQQNREEEHKGVNSEYITISTMEVNGGKSRHSERVRINGLYLKDVLDTKVMSYSSSSDIFNQYDKWFRKYATGRKFSKKELLDAAKGTEDAISERTFDKYVERLSDGKVTITTDGNKKLYEWTYDIMPAWGGTI